MRPCKQNWAPEGDYRDSVCVYTHAKPARPWIGACFQAFRGDWQSAKGDTETQMNVHNAYFSKKKKKTNSARPYIVIVSDVNKVIFVLIKREAHQTENVHE